MTQLQGPLNAHIVADHHDGVWVTQGLKSGTVQTSSRSCWMSEVTNFKLYRI
jgi:hypothetical protein